MPSNKWEEAVQKLVDRFMDYMECDEYHIHGDPYDTGHEGATPKPEHINFNEDKFKLALTNAVKELVVTAKPELRPDAAKQGELIPFDGKRRVEMHWLRKTQDAGYNQALDTYQANLLKAIGDTDG